MTVTIYTVDGASITVDDFDQDTLLELLTAMDGPLDAEPYTLRFALDEGFTEVARRHIVRVDAEPT